MKTVIYFIKIRDNDFNDYKKYLELLEPAKKDHIIRFRFDIDKKLSLFADLFIRYLACTVLKVSNKELIFDKNLFGKPYITGYPGFQYNISHTRNAVIIGVSGKSIGVDVEIIKQPNLKIAERFFCKNELAYILSREEMNKAFYEVWTKKEAYIKWTGQGLSLPLTSFDVTDFEVSKMLSIIEINDYMLAICSEVSFNKSNLEILDEEQMVKILSIFTECSV